MSVDIVHNLIFEPSKYLVNEVDEAKGPMERRI